MINLISLSNELANGHLASALEDAVVSIGKRIYLTDNGVRAMTPEEAKTDFHAHFIGLYYLVNLQNSSINYKIEYNANYSKLLQVYAKSLGEPLYLDDEQLKFRAEIDGVGYKSANLDLVSQVCKENFGMYEFKVPEYASISTFKIQSKLKDYGGIDIEKKWNEIINKHFPTSEQKEEVLRTKKWPPGFLMDCALLRSQIEEAVERIIVKEQSKTLDQIFESSGLDELITDAAQRKERLMVRSTGREDTKEFANAGGNTSVSNVIPDSNIVLLGIKEVITSYFGEKSLKQRLGVGDPSLFDETPFTPVLIQRMIGENS